MPSSPDTNYFGSIPVTASMGGTSRTGRWWLADRLIGPRKKSDELSGVIQCSFDGLAAKLLALLPGTWIGPQVE